MTEHKEEQNVFHATENEKCLELNLARWGWDSGCEQGLVLVLALEV